MGGWHRGTTPDPEATRGPHLPLLLLDQQQLPVVALQLCPAGFAVLRRRLAGQCVGQLQEQQLLARRNAQPLQQLRCRHVLRAAGGAAGRGGVLITGLFFHCGGERRWGWWVGGEWVGNGWALRVR